MNILEPSPEHVAQCFALEESLSFSAPDADEFGFFLPGATLDLYQDLFKTGYIRVILDPKGMVRSYVVAVPPGHSIINKMLTENPSMILCSEDFKLNPNTSVWIAKVATSKDSRRMGFARRLYAELFREFSGCTALTTTALAPKRNFLSEGLHASVGMHRAGVYLSPPRGEIAGIVNLLWQKQL
jgi:hypothetical protein